MENESSLFAVISAAVMRDTRLRANAKLLYGEITALARKGGYCWAENAHFAEVLGISTKTVSELISQLQKCGHIQVEVERDAQSHVVLARRLWITGPLGLESAPPPKNRGTSPVNPGDLPRKSGGPPPKNQAVIYDENNKENIPPIVPQGDDGACPNNSMGKTAPKWKPEAFEKFWEIYRTQCRGENRKGACRAWDKLKPTSELLAKIYYALNVQLGSEQWKRGIGIPYCSTYLNGRRWEDVEDDTQPSGDGGLLREEEQDGWR